MHQAVAVGDPFVAVVARSDGAEVILLPPYGIRITEPEGGCPGSYSAVDVKIPLFLAQGVQHADDAFRILLVAGPLGMEVGADAVEFEVLHIVVLHHLGAAAHKGVKIFLVGKLEIADLVVRMLHVPVSETLALGGSVAPHRTQPRADAGLLPAGGGVNALEALREHFVEIPQAVEFIPAVVPDEGVNGHAALLEKLFLPVFQDGQALFFRHALGGVRIIVAVDVQFIPGIIMDEGAVGHHAFPFHIGQEGAALLAGGKNSENGGYVPYFPGLQGGFTAPESLGQPGFVRLGFLLFLQRAHGQGKGDFPLAGNRFALGLGPVAQNVISPGGNLYRVSVAGIGISGAAVVEIGVKNGPLGREELHAGKVQLIVALVPSLILESEGACSFAVNGNRAFRTGNLFSVLLFQFLGNIEISGP